MATRQESATKTPVHTRTYVSRAGETPGAIRSLGCIAVQAVASGHLAARGDGLQSQLVNIDNPCKHCDCNEVAVQLIRPRSSIASAWQQHRSTVQHCAALRIDAAARLQKNCIATDQ